MRAFAPLSLLIILVACVTAATALHHDTAQRFASNNNEFVKAPATTTTPKHPTFSLPMSIKADFAVNSEGASQMVESIANSAGTKAIQRTSGPYGSYNALVRNDLGVLFYFYPAEGVNANNTLCYAFRTKAPINPANINNFVFSTTMLWRGQQVYVWRVTAGSQIFSVYTDPVSGEFLAQFNTESMLQTKNFFEFKTGANCPEPADSTFDIPAGCEMPPPPPSNSAVMAEEEAELMRRLLFDDVVTDDDDDTTASSSSFLPSSMDPLPFVTQLHKKRYHMLSENARHRLLKKWISSRHNHNNNNKRDHHQKKTDAQLLQQLIAEVATEMVDPSHLLNVVAPSSSSHRDQFAQVDYSSYCSPVRDQGSCGCCHTASSVGAAELFWNKKAGRKSIPPKYLTMDYSLSIQNVIDCAHGDLNGTALIADKGCFGGWPLTDMLYIVKNGIALERDYVYQAVNGGKCRTEEMPTIVKPFSDAKLVVNNSAAMEVHVMKYGAVVAIIQILPDFMTYDGGIYDNPKCLPGYSHAVLIVGYGVDPATGAAYWIVKNTFGRQWGGSPPGYFKMAKDKNMCGIEQFGFLPFP